MDELVWRLGYYDGVQWPDWKEHCEKGPNHGKGAQDPTWQWTPAFSEDNDYNSAEDVSKYVPVGTVWAVVKGPKPEDLSDG